MFGSVFVMIMVLQNYCNQTKQNPTWNIYSINVDSSDTTKTYHLLKKELSKIFKRNIVGITETGTVKVENENYSCSFFGYENANKFYSSKNKPRNGSAISSDSLHKILHKDVILKNTSGQTKGKLKIAENTDLILSGDMKTNVDLALSETDFDYFCNKICQLDIEFINHLTTIELIKLKRICHNYNAILSYQTIWKWDKIIARRNYLIVFIITSLYAIFSVLFMKAYIINSQKKIFRIYSVCGANPTHIKNIYFFIFTTLELLSWIVVFGIIFLMNCMIDLPIDMFPQFILCAAYGLIIFFVSIPWIGTVFQRAILHSEN